jgi:hypothetical protein
MSGIGKLAAIEEATDIGPPLVPVGSAVYDPGCVKTLYFIMIGVIPAI